ncbi:MAG: hemin uptake protein HemP [Planctomycetales bacterium]|nr:hemin uptake protein HemP [Planctomycetales bacterium]
MKEGIEEPKPPSDDSAENAGETRAGEGGPGEGSAGGASSAPADLRPPVVSSAQLLQGHRELWIEHNGELYRLRVTSRGNLYLTK